jgi:putative AlgH/UPF0301 family transcriptional regulator
MAINPSPFLDGKLLIAMPGIGDPRFDRSVIFLCAHSADGAMGIVINKVAQNITFPDLLSRLDLLPPESRITLDERLSQMPVQFGGPVETGRGFVLHTTDYYSADTTLPISERVGLTATLDVLRAIAKGEGPRRSAIRAGAPASSRTKSSETAGCTARRMKNSSSRSPMSRNIRQHWKRSASTRACFQPTPATPSTDFRISRPSAVAFPCEPARAWLRHRRTSARRQAGLRRQEASLPPWRLRSRQSPQKQA